MEFPATTATVSQLPNGIHVILDPDAFAPVVSAQVWVETGSMHEDHLLGSGVSHFLEHLVFKGTRDYGADELSAAVQGAGGHWNAYTTFGRTVYYIDGPSQSLHEFLRCLTGLVYFPTLPEGEFDREKDVIRREIDMGLDDPNQVSSQLMFSGVFRRDPRRYPVIGHRHLFDRIGHADLLEYHRARYTADRTFVVVSGDFEAEQVLRWLEELTEGCQVGGGREPWLVEDPPQIGPRFVRDQFEVAATRVNFAWKCPELGHPDNAAWSVLAEVLGNGKSSRLYRALREESGLAMEVSAYSWSMPAREGVFGVGVYVEPVKLENLIDAVHDELAKLATEVSEDEISKAKRQISLAQFRTLTSASGRASDLASNWHEARDLNFTRRYLKSIWEVSAADIVRLAATLVPDRCTMAVLEPKGTTAAVASTRKSPKRTEVICRTLENGLRVGVMRDQRVPTVQLRATVKAGVCSESDATNGLNSLLAASLSKGSQRRSGHEIALALESMGATFGASAGNVFTQVQTRGLADDFDSLLDLFHEVLSGPSFPEDAMARDKASQLALISESLQDPLHVGMVGLRRAVFGSVGHGRDLLGTSDSVSSLTREDLLAHHGRHFGAANLVLTAVGDLDPERMLDEISMKFAALPASTWICDEPDFLDRPVTHLVTLPKKQAIIVLGYPSYGMLAPERRMVAMLQDYAGDMAGPLFTRIREELGLAYQVGAGCYQGLQQGLFLCYCSTSAEQAELAKEELLLQMRNIASGGIPDDVFGRVRATVLSGLALQQQSPDAMTRQMAVDWHCGRPVDEFTRVAEHYKQISPTQVREVAAQTFSAQPVISMVLPSADSI